MFLATRSLSLGAFAGWWFFEIRFSWFRFIKCSRPRVWAVWKEHTWFVPSACLFSDISITFFWFTATMQNSLQHTLCCIQPCNRSSGYYWWCDSIYFSLPDAIITMFKLAPIYWFYFKLFTDSKCKRFEGKISTNEAKRQSSVFHRCRHSSGQPNSRANFKMIFVFHRCQVL